MARRKQGSFPSLRHHKASGLAVVTLSGQDFYCGNFGTKASFAEYDRLIAEWLARGRRSVAPLASDDEITVVELIAAYKRFAEGYYRKKGKVTNEVTATLAVSPHRREDARIALESWS